MRQLVFIVIGVSALLFPALGATESPAPNAHRAGPLGLVAPQVVGHAVGHFRSPRPNFGASPFAAATGPTKVDNLTYHGPDQSGNGPVMRTNTVYAIYWVPSGFSTPAGYKTIVDRYFTDVAAASGAATNVYSAGVQYSDTTGRIAYASTFGGSAVDTHTFPASDCTNPSDVVGATECLGDDQLQTEVKRFADSQGWPHGPNVEFFLYTPENVGSCFYSDANAPWWGNACAYDVYCAYHSEFDSGTTASEYVYANMPWLNQEVDFGDGFIYSSDCDSGQHPNGSGADASDANAADEVINVTSHEHNESITDPLGTAWWDDNPNSDYQGYEDGDLCQWSWYYTGGPTGVIGGSMNDGSAYNQSINGDHYFAQAEWSNKSATGGSWSGCVWKFAFVPANTGAPTITGTATVGQTLTGGAGSWTGSPTSYTYAWLRCDAGGNNCKTAKTATSSSTSATYVPVAADDKQTIKLSVVATSSAGSSTAALSSPTAVVNGEPVNTGAPSLSGTATVGQTLTGNVGTWNPAATKFQSQLLRCDNAGANCATIKTFTTASISYVLVAADDKHKLRLSVVASNTAGASSAAVSSATAAVNGEPVNSGAPAISGTAAVGQVLTGTAGTWSPAATSYQYSWLRCDSGGNNCTTIKTVKATTTSQTYKPVTADKSHRLKLSVVASNAAGASSSATSSPTAVVP